MSLFGNWFKKTRTILVNGDLTITFKNGNSIVFHNATRSMYNTISVMTDDGDIITYYYDMLDVQAEQTRLEREQNSAKKTVHEIIEKKQAEKTTRAEKQEELQQEVNLVQEVKNSFPNLIDTGDFETENRSIYMTIDGKRLPLSIPNSLLKRFVDLTKQIEGNNEAALEEYMALKNFWMWLSLNPVAANRERLYDFITRNGLKINKHGLFFSYRMILATDRGNSQMSKEMVAAISDAYFKIKKAKKGPHNFVLIEGEDGIYSYQHISKETPEDYDDVGNIGDLYESLSANQEQMFTDNYTKTFDIRIGQEVSQDPSECNFDSTVTFSKGLHSGSVNFGLFTGFGDTPVLTLINPRNVCAVPTQDVLRSTAYLPVSIIKDTKQASEVLREGNTLEIASEYYTDSVKQLKDLVKNNTPQELKRHEVMSDISPEAMTMIVNSVENIGDTLKSRTITVA